MLSQHLAQTFQKLAINRAEQEGWQEQGIRQFLATIQKNGSWFVHFSNIANFELNVSSPFLTTPIGIYSYPVDSKIDELLNQGDLPLAGERWFAYVFQPSGKVLHLHTYSRANLESDIDKLKDLYPEHLVDAIFEKLPATSSPGAKLWDGTNELAGRKLSKWTSTLKALGYTGAVDSGDGIIHENEPRQAVFFSKDSLKNVKRFDMTQGRKDKNIPAIDKLTPEALDSISDVVSKLPFVNSPEVARYTENLSKVLEEAKSKVGDDKVRLGKIYKILAQIEARKKFRSNYKKVELLNENPITGTPVFETSPKNLQNIEAIRGALAKLVSTIENPNSTVKDIRSVWMSSFGDMSEEKIKSIQKSIIPKIRGDRGKLLALIAFNSAYNSYTMLAYDNIDAAERLGVLTPAFAKYLLAQTEFEKIDGFDEYLAEKLVDQADGKDPEDPIIHQIVDAMPVVDFNSGTSLNRMLASKEIALRLLEEGKISYVGICQAMIGLNIPPEEVNVWGAEVLDDIASFFWRWMFYQVFDRHYKLDELVSNYIYRYKSDLAYSYRKPLLSLMSDRLEDPDYPVADKKEILKLKKLLGSVLNV
jgi:hypothetical protein